MNIWMLTIALSLAVITAILVTLACPWLEEHGYLFPRVGKVSHAALAVGAIFKA